MVSGAKVEKAECGRILRHRHCVGESNYHLQFTPNFRRKVFLPAEVRNRCKDAITEKATELGVTLYAIEFGPDHCHVFVGNCRNFSVPELVQYFKGYSSRVIREDLWPIVSQYLWGDHFWSEGYFYESIGRVTSQAVKFYVERQQGKHWKHEDFDCRLPLTEDKAQSNLSQFL